MRLIRTLTVAQELLQEPVWSKRWAEWSQVHIFGGRQTWKFVFNDDGRLTILYGVSGIDP